MRQTKPIQILWSKSARDIAGTNQSCVLKKFLDDIKSFLPGMEGSFGHAIPIGDNETCYLFTGTEFPKFWKVFCQIARYKPMPPALPDDHPNPKLRGKMIKLPEPVDEPDNEVFEGHEGTSE